MQRIAESSRGFTYSVSVTGVTGERVKLQDRVATLVSDLKACNSRPVAVGVWDFWPRPGFASETVGG